MALTPLQTFSGKTTAQQAWLDDNFNQTSVQGMIPCRSVGGPNALTLSQTSIGAPVLALQAYQVLCFIASATNTSSVTCNPFGLGALPVYVDTLIGPLILIGGEIVANNVIWLAYDPALDSGGGGFHLVNPHT